MAAKAAVAYKQSEFPADPDTANVIIQGYLNLARLFSQMSPSLKGDPSKILKPLEDRLATKLRTKRTDVASSYQYISNLIKESVKHGVVVNTQGTTIPLLNRAITMIYDPSMMNDNVSVIEAKYKDAVKMLVIEDEKGGNQLVRNAVLLTKQLTPDELRAAVLAASPAAPTATPTTAFNSNNRLLA